jgi:hypothetical protein
MEYVISRQGEYSMSNRQQDGSRTKTDLEGLSPIPASERTMG